MFYKYVYKVLKESRGNSSDEVPRKDAPSYCIVNKNPFHTK